MVTRHFTQSLAWLHARVGRRSPITLVRDNDRLTLNSRLRRIPVAVPALRPTVHLPSRSDHTLVG